MGADENMKVCPLCAEPVKAAAKVCPCCCASQTRFALWRPYFGLAFSLCIMFAVIAVECAWLFPDAFRSEGRVFAPYRAQLVVARTSLEGAREGRPESWLSGYVSNTGNYPWRVRQLEVRFFGAGHKLVDVRHAGVPEEFVVQPHQEQAFRVGIGRLVFTNSGITEQVRVQSATDGNRPGKPD
jgi:hypothetical protein